MCQRGSLLGLSSWTDQDFVNINMRWLEDGIHHRTGNIIGLKVAKHVGSDKIWFTYRGRRYDVKKNGTLAADVKVGKPSIVPQALAKTVKCQLCGGQTPIPQFVTEARCPQCGFPLVRCNVVRRN